MRVEMNFMGVTTDFLNLKTDSESCNMSHGKLIVFYICGFHKLKLRLQYYSKCYLLDNFTDH